MLINIWFSYCKLCHSLYLLLYPKRKRNKTMFDFDQYLGFFSILIVTMRVLVVCFIPFNICSCLLDVWFRQLSVFKEMREEKKRRLRT
jgi:cadmium resistance protein CadD (predicted permease)